MVSSHRSHSSGSSKTVTNSPRHSPIQTEGMAFPQTSSTGLYTAYTIIPIPADNRTNAAKYFCTYRGCTYRCDTPCDLQRHRLEGKCSPIWNTASNPDALSANIGTTSSSGFLRCQLCYDYIASCNYRPLIEHIRTEHCGLPSTYLEASAGSTILIQGQEPFNAFAHATDSSMAYNQQPFQQMQNSYVHNHDFFGHPQIPADPIDQHDVFEYSLDPTHAPPNEAMASNKLNPEVAESSDRKGKGASTVALDWEKYKSELQRLYVEEDNNLEQVMGQMNTTYGFNAKKRTYKEKLKLWGFEKNVPARDMRLIVAMVEKRKREEGKETRVYFKDRLVEPKKMERFKKRKLAPHDSEEDNLSASFRRHVRCETPMSESEEVEKPSTEPGFFIGPVDLETLGSVILDEYEGKQSAKIRFTQCHHTGLGHVEHLFTEATAQHKQGDLETSEKTYLQIISAPPSKKDIGTVFDALRGILRIHALGVDYSPSLPELERLVAGCLCLFGPTHPTYLTLAVELTISYYRLDRYDEANALAKRLFALYKSTTGPLPEESTSRLLYWASGRIIYLSPIPDFKTIYNRLLHQYEESGNHRSAILLAMDVADGLQFSHDFQEADYYMLSACAFYEALGPDAGKEHIEMLTGLLLLQCQHLLRTCIDESLLDKFRRETLAIHPLRHIPLTRIALSYSALHLHAKAHALYTSLDLEDTVLRGGRFSRENWKLLIWGLGDEACNLAAAGEWEHAERMFILAEELALRELGAEHWRSKGAVKSLKMFEQRDPDLWVGRVEALEGRRGGARVGMEGLEGLYESTGLIVD